jgi:hypothetical protein
MLFRIFHQIVAFQSARKHSAAPLTLATCSYQARKNGTQLVGQILQPIFCEAMHNNQMRHEPIHRDLFLAQQAIVAQHVLQIRVIPNEMKVPCHHGHRHLLKFRQWQQGFKHCRKFHRRKCPWQDQLPMKICCNNRKLAQTHTFVQGLPPAAAGVTKATQVHEQSPLQKFLDVERLLQSFCMLFM